MIFESSFMPQFCANSKNILSRAHYLASLHVSEFVSVDGCSGNSIYDEDVKPLAYSLVMSSLASTMHARDSNSMLV